MEKYRCRGTITVFLSLVSVLFLSLLCTTIESARIQGTRGKGAAALDMGMFSVLGEFEKELLNRYDVFFLDGAYGDKNLRIESIHARMEEYMEYNVTSNKGLLIKGFDPFKLVLEKTEVTGWQLATDEGGGAFYQQAVGFMKENLGTELVSTLLARSEEAKKMEEAGKLYQEREKTVGEQLKQLESEREKAEEEKRQELLKQQEEGVEILEPETEPPKIPAARNPLTAIRKIKRKTLMELVLGGESVSEKTTPANVPSRRNCRKGNLPVEKIHRGFSADLLFQEYLFQRFSLYTDKEKEGVLDYQLEYILCGSPSDEKNLKSVITRLLLMREGANFLYLANDAESKLAADAMAALLVGLIPIPGLQSVTSYALLLAWAYGESLLDVRELMAGGKVPLMKTQETWKLSLTNIPDLAEILESTKGNSKEGVDYPGYLQILFTLGSRSKYPIRALDIIEGSLRKNPGTGNFRADHAVSKIEAKAKFQIPPVFLKVSNRFLRTGVTTKEYQVSGSFAY